MLRRGENLQQSVSLLEDFDSDSWVKRAVRRIGRRICWWMLLGSTGRFSCGCCTTFQESPLTNSSVCGFAASLWRVWRPRPPDTRGGLGGKASHPANTGLRGVLFVSFLSLFPLTYKTQPSNSELLHVATHFMGCCGGLPALAINNVRRA